MTRRFVRFRRTYLLVKPLLLAAVTDDRSVDGLCTLHSLSTDRSLATAAYFFQKFSKYLQFGNGRKSSFGTDSQLPAAVPISFIQKLCLEFVNGRELSL
jgi:hypothetical protein